MKARFDKLIEIQHRDEASEVWEPYKKKLASINRTGGAESYSNGAEKIHNRLTFEIRYDPGLFDLCPDPGSYRIVYRGLSFNLVSYDDYFEAHETIKLVGESYG
ncbi:head-tail adaptor protein [uncultured Dubosiella sp.]|nr:head-tail adaptor protein [uncultured Dubosiella sp.]